MVVSLGVVGTSVRRWGTGGLLAGIVLFGTAGKSEGQRAVKQRRARRETNASRQARIDRTIQDTYSHQWEVFGGGGYLRWKSGDDTKKNNEVSWATSANYYLTPKFAIVGDARGSFGNAHQQEISQSANPTTFYYAQIPNPQINEYYFTGGASYRFYAKEKLALSAQATGGVVWGIFSGGSKDIPSVDLGLWQDGFKPAFIFNVSADYNFYPNLAFRVSPTYVGTTFGGGVQNNLGINAGVVYRFGRRK
ncbi:MAG: hypothetical protein ACRYFU_13920 [Janthinobacterium lividum]